MQKPKVKVLYIAGDYRSGSTILGNILGQINGFFFSSELRSIWDMGLMEDYECGCGVPFNQCEVWKNILTCAFGGKHQIIAKQMIKLRRHAFRTRNVPFAMFNKKIQSRYRYRMRNYLNQLEKLYMAIQHTTGCRVIIDSSCIVSHAFLLQMIPSIDLFTLHLIRDARGVAYSWLRKKPLGYSRGHMMSRTPRKSALLWITANLIAGMLQRESEGKYVRIRYEDFIREPVETVDSILSMLGEESRHLPFVGSHEVYLKRNHGIWGNPNRFGTGVIRLRIDDEWRTKMSRYDRLCVTALSWPLLARYRYLKPNYRLPQKSERIP